MSKHLRGSLFHRKMKKRERYQDHNTNGVQTTAAREGWLSARQQARKLPLNFQPFGQEIHLHFVMMQHFPHRQCLAVDLARGAS